MTYTVRQAVRTNNRPNKPCEDRIAATSDTFVVADGVTQSIDEYREGMTVSPAGQAAQITAESILSVLKDAADPTAAAPEAVRRAIERTGAYNETKPSAYPAAAVYVSGAIREGRLHFSYVGDSVIMLIRRGARIRLSEQQTAHLRIQRHAYTTHDHRPRELVRQLLIKAALPLQHLHQIACPLFHTVILSLQLILKVITADPLQHIINILKMIIKTLAAHPRCLHDVPDRNFGYLLALHQLPDTIRNFFLS